jgi:hypothetical protein
MNWLTTFRPRRELALPFLMAAFPLLYFVYRDASAACPAGTGCLDLEHVGYALAGLAASYLLAVALLALLDVRALAADYGYARLAFRPTDGTLLVLGVLVGAVAAYAVATLVARVPTWLDQFLTPLGLIVGLPFAAIAAGMTLVGSAVGKEPSMAVQFAVVGVSLALTGAWVFLLATGAAGLLTGAVSGGVKSG